MKSEIEVPMESASQAKLALKAVAPEGLESARAQVRYAAKGSAFTAVITAKDFAALRARTTSLFRDLKVFLDSTKATRK
jgi:tRNA threonylcarbamoyladenosine modification (KEOPS) complex  Pcc1 subunit